LKQDIRKYFTVLMFIQRFLFLKISRLEPVSGLLFTSESNPIIKIKKEGVPDICLYTLSNQINE